MARIARSVLVVAVLMGLSPIASASATSAKPNPGIARMRGLVSRPLAALKRATAHPKLGESNLVQKAIVATHLVATSAIATELALHTKAWWQVPVMAMTLYAGHQSAEVPSAVYHFGLDNYFQNTKGWLGRVATRFQKHHDFASEVTLHSFAENAEAAGRFTAPIVAALALHHSFPDTHSLVASTAHLAEKAFWLGTVNGGFLAIPAHVWSHMNPKKVPRVVRAAQEAGMMITSKAHGRHHHQPFDGNYGILTGKSNKFMDQHKVWRKIEALAYRHTGAIPNSWRDGELGYRTMVDALGEKAAATVPLGPPEQK